MKQPQLREMSLNNFRCFKDEHLARLAPLTLLVGENSTGKTSFLAAVRAAWEVCHQHTDPDFRQPPYDLGSFFEVAHSGGENGTSSTSFEIGFETTATEDLPFRFKAVFAPLVVEPLPVHLSWYRDDVWLACDLSASDSLTIDFGTSDSTWRLEHSRTSRYWDIRMSMYLGMDIFHGRHKGDELRHIRGPTKFPDKRYLRCLGSLVEDVTRTHHLPPFASAAIRSKPLWTYDHTRPSPDPEGAYVPSYFANVQIQDQKQWSELRSRLEVFGRSSGLFDEIYLSQLGASPGGPFQMEIRRHGGPRRNLIDVGYGVSQVFPVLAEMYRPGGASMLLLQQPEVHLHPSAQAALGSLFCATAATGRQLIIETHSDYIVDRILLDIRDKATGLRSNDVSILYFERDGLHVTIHSVRLDDEGNVIDPPVGYRSFFRDELKRVIDY